MTMTWSTVMPMVMVLCDDKVMEHFDDKGGVLCDRLEGWDGEGVREGDA